MDQIPQAGPVQRIIKYAIAVVDAELSNMIETNVCSVEGKLAAFKAFEAKQDLSIEDR